MLDVVLRLICGGRRLRGAPGKARGRLADMFDGCDSSAGVDRLWRYFLLPEGKR